MQKLLEILGAHFKVRLWSLEFKNCQDSEALLWSKVVRKHSSPKLFTIQYEGVKSQRRGEIILSLKWLKMSKSHVLDRFILKDCIV